jgi:uncharacterized protein involved in exopolysaccharide biosynthesis
MLAAMGAVTGYVLSGASPNYRSEARLQVVPPRVPDDIVPSPALPRLEERIATMTQVVMSRTRLERLIRDFKLYERERASGVVMQDLIETMRKDISVAIDPTAGNASQFVVSFTSKDPRVAQKVTEKLASFFIDESLKDGARRAENPSDFVESQVEETGRRLAAHDERMAAARLAGGRDSARMQIEAEVLRSNYKAMLEKREQASMRVTMERRQIGEQFVLLEQARVPERAEGPTRRAAAIAGALAGLAVGLVVSLFLAIRRAIARAFAVRVVDAKTGV